MPLTLTVCCFSKIQIGFTFLVLAHLGSPGQRAVKRVCVCVCLLWLDVRLLRCVTCLQRWSSISRTAFITASWTTALRRATLDTDSLLTKRQWPYCSSSLMIVMTTMMMYHYDHYLCMSCLQCFDAVGCVAGRASGLSKTVGGCWHGYLSGARCRLAYGAADATATHCLLLQ